MNRLNSHAHNCSISVLQAVNDAWWSVGDFIDKCHDERTTNRKYDRSTEKQFWNVDTWMNRHQLCQLFKSLNWFLDCVAPLSENLWTYSSHKLLILLFDIPVRWRRWIFFSFQCQVVGKIISVRVIFFYFSCFISSVSTYILHINWTELKNWCLWVSAFWTYF